MSLNGEIVFANTDFDPFAVSTVDNHSSNQQQKRRELSVVHIRSQQRNGRKSLTTISGLANDLDLHKIVRCMKKMFSTNGTILYDDDGNEVIQLQGDRRREAAEFLVKYKVCEKEEVHVHGA